MRARRLAASGVAAGALLHAALAAAEPRPPSQPGPTLRRDVPCAGCLLRLPAGAGSGAVPLVVALHGDNGAPARLVELLQDEADRRGYAVLALACPRKLGCDQRSFWQWGGAPTWLAAQLDGLAKLPPAAQLPRPIDAQRIYLLAWSGGASYVTDVIADLPSRFAALALLGGGMPSRHGATCARCRLPVYYALGERNPLAALALAAQDALRRCGHPLRTVSLTGADHAGEWAALAHGRIAEVLAFFAEHTRSCADP
jgi:poly(3-hydroxybutyrate) depolymerase